MNIIFKGAVAAAILGATTTVVSATTVDVTYQDPNVFGEPNLSAVVSITSPEYTGKVYAGPFRLTGSGGFGDFVGFCIDLGHYMTNGKTYTASGASAYGAAVDENISRLFSSAYAGLTTAIQGAAFQVALWEIITDTGTGLDLAGGDFTAGWNTAVLDQATSFLDGLDGAGTGGYEFTYLNSDSSQDLVTVSPVPVPAAFGLLGLGIAGLFGLRRRKKA